MVSAQNATWLREVTFLSGTVFKSEEVKASVEHLQNALAAGLGPEQFFLMTVTGKIAKNSRFYKAVSKAAEILEFSKADKPWELEKEALGMLREALDDRGISAPGAVLALMSARIGGDRRLMAQEVEKVDLYLGERRDLRREDVELMVGAHQESQVFELSDCIGNRDLPRAMDLLSRLENQGASPIGVMATLHNALREMGYLRALLAEGAGRLEENGRFGKFVFVDETAKEGFQTLIGEKSRSPFRLYTLARQSRGFTLGQMDRMIRMSSETYGRMFKSTLGQYDLLRVLVLSIFYPNPGARAS
jgi:DNA polymerase-3 subunit delta